MSNIAWAAGVLEGEGCFSIHTRSRTGKQEFAIHCEMTDEDVVRRLYNIFLVGSICYRENKRKDGRTRKPSWIWSVQSKVAILSVLKQITPYMGYRRQTKIMEMIKGINESL